MTTTEQLTLIKSYMSEDYEFTGDWSTLMPIVHKLVRDGAVLIWKVARADGVNGFSCSIGDERVKSFASEGYVCMYMAVIRQLQHWHRYKDARAN